MIRPPDSRGSRSSFRIPCLQHGHPMTTAKKRTFDVVLGSVLALACLPIITILAICVACSMRCSPFFSQDRVGYRGKIFRIWKLRTLPKSTPSYADKYTIEVVKTTRFARFLRRTHLDELPPSRLVRRPEV